MILWRSFRRPVFWLVAGLFVAGTAPTGAGAAEDLLDRIYPNGAQRGQTVTLTLGGKVIPDNGTLVVDGEGITPLGEFVKGVGKVRVDADAAPGVRQLRLVGPKAATTPRPFVVGVLPEIEEKEPNDRNDQAQRIEALPVTINGTLVTRTEIDTFRIAMKQDECLVVAGESRLLGSPINLLTRVRDAAGRELVVQMDYRTRDALLGFTAPADGDYLVQIQEVMNNYSSVDPNYVYRLTLTKGPWLDYVYPPGAQRGKSARLTFHGWNLEGRPGTSTAVRDVEVPESGDDDRVLLAEADAPNRVPLQLGGYPERVRMGGAQELQGAEGTPLQPPATVSGRLTRRKQRDVHLFHASKGEVLVLEVEARTIESMADPVLSIRGPDGKQLATADDAGGGRRGGSRDPVLTWTAPENGIYSAVVKDVADGSRAGAAYFYRLSIGPPVSAVRLSLPVTQIAIKPGEKAEVVLTVAQEGLKELVKVTLTGLPAGVTAADLTVPATGRNTSSDVKLVLSAGKDARPSHSLLRIQAQSGSVGAAAEGTWVLSSDRSGTLATGRTRTILVQVVAP